MLDLIAFALMRWEHASWEHALRYTRDKLKRIMDRHDTLWTRIESALETTHQVRALLSGASLMHPQEIESLMAEWCAALAWVHGCAPAIRTCNAHVSLKLSTTQRHDIEITYTQRADTQGVFRAQLGVERPYACTQRTQRAPYVKVHCPSFAYRFTPPTRSWRLAMGDGDDTSRFAHIDNALSAHELDVASSWIRRMSCGTRAKRLLGLTLEQAGVRHMRISIPTKHKNPKNKEAYTYAYANIDKIHNALQSLCAPATCDIIKEAHSTQLTCTLIHKRDGHTRRTASWSHLEADVANECHFMILEQAY